jgi:uncharacterized C2H2 Zn-finger protein
MKEWAFQPSATEEESQKIPGPSRSLAAFHSRDAEFSRVSTAGAASARLSTAPAENSQPTTTPQILIRFPQTPLAIFLAETQTSNDFGRKVSAGTQIPASQCARSVAKMRMTVVSSDDESDGDYDMLESESDDDFPASTAPSSPPNASSSKLPRQRQKVHQCTFEDCDKVFDRKARLEDHLRSHNNERNYKCPIALCEKTFLRDSHLKHHVKNQHTEIRDYHCTWEGCNSSFTTGTRLRRHVASHEAKENFRCRGFAGCDQTFRKQKTLDRHILTVHKGIKPFPCTEKDPVTGDLCNKAYDTAENLRSHIRAKHDTDRFSCEICRFYNAIILANTGDPEDSKIRPANFPTYALLQEHNAKFHPPNCHLCPTSFITNKELTRHLELQHGILSEKKKKAATEESSVLTCTFPGCGKQFSKKGNLNVHVKTVHENKRDFVCGETPLSAQIDEAGSLVNETVHGCGRSFTSKASLEEHVRTAHLELPSKRMMREKKRKGDDLLADEGSGFKKARKPRSDKGKPRGSAMAGLLGLNKAPTTAAEPEEGPFPFGFGEAPGTQDLESAAASMQQDSNVPRNLGTPPFSNQKMDLSTSMTILGDYIYSEGVAYHYPSGEYPTSRTGQYEPTITPQDLERDLRRASVYDDSEEVNFFGEFEQEQELEPAGLGYAYPAL